MKRTKNDDSNSKALQERYSRILGLDDVPVVEARKKCPVYRYVLCFLLVVAVIAGAWFLFKSPAESTNQLAPAASKIKQTVSDDKAGEPTALNNPADTDILKIGQSAAPNHGEMSHNPAVPSTLLIVLLSTTSKDEAIERAKEFSKNGFLSEVILSSTGYYAVVLRSESHEQAKDTMKAIIASGKTAKNKPYIITTDRIKDYIYP